MLDQFFHWLATVIAWLWIWIHDALVMIGLPAGSGVAWVISIVLVTIVVRTAILPLTIRSIRSSRGMQAMQPELKKLQEKYKGKKDAASQQKMAAESQALYKKHGTSPFASCLPMLAQLPIFLAMYRVFIGVSQITQGTYLVDGKPTDTIGPITKALAAEVENSTVGGVNLSLRITDNLPIFGIVVFALILVATVLMQSFSMLLSMKKNMPAQADPDNPMVRSQRMMIYIMPLIFATTGFIFPMGLMVYTAATAAFTLAQSYFTIKFMPTPGSPAHSELVEKRQARYQGWAKEFFADYDRQRLALSSSDTTALAELNRTTVAEVKKRGKAQHIATDFPEAMSDGEVLEVYRNLATGSWEGTLPDEQWMRAIKRATDRVAEKKAQQAAREQHRKLSREQRKARQNKDETAEGSQSSSTSGSSRATAGGDYSPEELERRRQARRKDQRDRQRRKRRPK
ncbi:MAG: membrane protein insertase YidC [Actinomycetaceae bacterium]|nr:membrane protein insertase YidC [Actinomycetaceae bacterium]